MIEKSFKMAVIGLGLAIAVSGAAAATASRTSQGNQGGNGNGNGNGHQNHRQPMNIVSFETMYGVDGPFIGEANRVRGVEGDEAPWGIESAVGSLDTNGHLKIRVRGLVFKDDPRVPPNLVGKNDETEFRGLVSCLTEGVTDTPTVNVVTRGFHASTSGDSNIDAMIDLPNPCIAPIVMILAGSEDKWFAITGVEEEGD